MDLRLIKKLSFLTVIWLSLFIAVIVTTVVSRSTTWLAWVTYSILVGAVFLGLKLWNRNLQEPLLDTNPNTLELCLSVLLAMLVGFAGGPLMLLDEMKFVPYTCLLAIVMTGSQFTLLKSVQPDPASPTHGFNSIVSLSKPIYFCLLSLVVLASESYTRYYSLNDLSSSRPSLVFYSFDVFDGQVVHVLGYASMLLLLSFPAIFILGLMPQITTFTIYVLEQIDVHFFGSTASTLGLKSAVYSFARSLAAISLLYLIASQSVGNQKLFSLYCGLLVSVSYLLSRNSSDVTIAYRLLKRIIASLNSAKHNHAIEKIEMEEIRAPQPVQQPVPESTSTTPQVVMPDTPSSSEPQDQAQDNPSPSSDVGTVEEEGTIEAASSREVTIAEVLPEAETSHNHNHNLEEPSLLVVQEPEGIAVESNTNTLDREEKNLEADSLTARIQACVDDICIKRLKNDLIRCICITVIVFAVHVTTVFSMYHDLIEKCFGLLAILWGLLFHYVIPQLRRDIPCVCLAKPLLKPREYNFFEVKTHAKLMWFERVHCIALAFEKNFIYPIFWLNTISQDVTAIKDSYGSYIGPLILVIISLKLVRSSFNDASSNYFIIIFTYLFFNYDVALYNHRIFAMNYFVFSILQAKMQELLLKLQFIYIYIAPWQIPWGSAFHAFAQPFSVPHSALLFFQAILSSILSAPLQPIFGSAIFVMSYVRPIKFWERDYNTNVIDINSTRLVTQLERNRIDSNRLDGVFYEHLTKCLQRNLCKDLNLGRWGPVSQGDCFVMASDNLNCLVHIIELGNGVCTFQLRGLEFKGTYCQQQEVEAISEGVLQDDKCCCCEPGHLPYLLSANAACNQLWLAWHVTHTRYVLKGYSISENPAGPMLQPFDLRRALIIYYVKSIIYFTITSTQLSKWLKIRDFHEALEHTKDKMYVDLDPTFSLSLDLDFDSRLCGVTRTKFCSVYFDWIKYCVDRVKNDKEDTQRAKLIANLDCNPDSFLVSLCYGLSLLARRSLSAAADGPQFHTVESLLHGLHALLKGDFRVTSLHDEWIFQEMSFFRLVVIPAVRMSLKLHQDHFAAPDDYEDNMTLYEAIAGYQKNLVISHETDVAWRNAILSGVPSLLTLRLYTDENSNQYKFIMLNRRYLSFRIIKVNRECVRGLWASQQQELIFFRNTDPERGSIQNARQALRNMINSSCDQPVGYPIYVSPLTTSYSESGSVPGDGSGSSSITID